MTVFYDVECTDCGESIRLPIRDDAVTEEEFLFQLLDTFIVEYWECSCESRRYAQRKL